MPTFVVDVVEGPDKGVRHAIDGSTPSRVLVGKSEACELRLTDAAVSRRHFALDLSGSWLRITDLQSTNGTFVNGIAVVEAYLDGGEFVRIGDTTLHVKQLEEPTTLHVSPRTAFGKTIGESDAMRRLYPLCERLARSDVPVVIEGETGTGKEVLAESLHDAGARAAGPFIVFDCTAVPANLLESALFGHERGAFTGAASARAGVFEQAHGGTLLIDEIGDLDLSLQPKLLRAIQRMEVQRVGGSRWLKCDVRVIAATRRNLDREVQAGRFRDDLFYRLNVGRIELPPLRRRTGDVTLLARHFWRSMGGSPPGPDESLLRKFEDYDWPGNVRELYNTVARHLALGELATFDPTRAEAPPETTEGHDTIGEVIALRLPLPAARQKVVDVFERRYLEHVLAEHGGNVARAAEASGIARRYFYLLRAKQR